MKRLLPAILSIFCIASLQANPGDTIKVRSHDKVHMNWFGSFDRKSKFPDATKSFNRIWMQYTLGCPTKGCSEWDYTTQVQLRKPTGKYDSTKQQAPSFKVNGAEKDSLWYSNTVTYKYTFNATTKSMDSTANDTLKIEQYEDSLTPLKITKSFNGWPGNYYKPVYDSTGKKTDSVYIGYTGLLAKKYYNYYQVFEIMEEYELGRVITPYNGGVPFGWQYTYTFDVTDYAPLLRDSVEIRAFFSGYQDGFTITLDFEFIEGTPARECYKIIPLWNGSSAFGGNPSIENFLTPKNVSIDAQMKQAMLHIIQTGHGFGGSDGCAEFCPKNHFVKIDGQTRYQKSVWRDNCGLNPLYPQGGTWVYDRSNWCPGAEVWPYDYDVSKFLTAGNPAIIDLDMEAYTNQGNSNTSYIISGVLFLYKDNAFATDASLEEVLAPNNTVRYARFNPVCDYPKVKVKNNGRDTIKTIEFSFGPKGGSSNTYTWSGTIAPYQTEEVKMGTNINFSLATPTNIFETEITKVNGKTDEVPYNNRRNTQYTATPIYPNQFVIWFNTNNQASQNSYTIKDFYGNTIVSKNNFSNALSYRDTIALVNGCYTFEFKDDGGDGIAFWANPNAGNGSLSFRKLGNNQVIKNFNGDFGSSIIQNFTAGYALGVDETPATSFIDIYPNPGAGKFKIDFNLVQSNTAKLIVYNLNGQLVINETVTAAQFSGYEIDLQGMPAGMYMVRVIADEGIFTQKITKTN